jgi:DNA (cytosine-5)-methyltransferase 1
MTIHQYLERKYFRMNTTATRGSKTELNNRPSSVSRNVTHPNRNGFKRSDCQHEEQPSEGGEYAQRYFEQNVIANTESIGQGNALENGELERGRFRKSNQRNAWDSFPSVSPICTGDDGLSSRLDGITFSKWRNESIKAAGNAIVPQVALQIFKTIQQYETLPRMADNFSIFA